MGKKNKIVFMGTPDFAVPSLHALYKNGYEIALVVTQPDRPKGRGRKLSSSPVKKAALDFGLDIIQPEDINAHEFYLKLSKLAPDFFVVVAFGQKLGVKILSVPGTGSINVHASILPKYRGAAPVQWSIINGDRKTGITTMLMDKGLDTGDILLTSTIRIKPDETASSLHDLLAVRGAELLIKTLDLYEAGNINPIPQNHQQVSYAPLIKKNDGRINWNMPAESLDAFIRGMNPWPGAFTFFNKQRLKILEAAPVPSDTDALPGTVLKSFPGELIIAAGKGALSVLKIQGASGKRLLIEDFLQGCEIDAGTLLS